MGNTFNTRRGWPGASLWSPILKSEFATNHAAGMQRLRLTPSAAVDGPWTDKQSVPWMCPVLMSWLVWDSVLVAAISLINLLICWHHRRNHFQLLINGPWTGAEPPQCYDPLPRPPPSGRDAAAEEEKCRHSIEI